jgi:3-oxoacyl-[acyl-carrier protein] reductase
LVRGIAKACGEQGASVVVNFAYSKAGGDRVVKHIVSHGGHAIAVQADLSKASYIEAPFAETKKQFGRLDTLVNNAGLQVRPDRSGG